MSSPDRSADAPPDDAEVAVDDGAGDSPAIWKPLVLVGVLVLIIPAVIAVISTRNRTPEGASADGPPKSLVDRAPLTSVDSSCYEGGGPATTSPAAPPTELRFTEVTKAAGLCHLQHEYRVPPNCFFNKPGDLPSRNLDDTASLYSQCLIERFTGGASVADYDDDGKPDVYLTQLRKGPPGALYRNNGDGTFTDVTAKSRLDNVEGNGNGATWVDIDNDGDRDLVVTTVSSPRYFLFVNNGDGTFDEQAEARGTALADDKPRSGFSVGAGDYDNDGYTDLFFTEWQKPGDWTNRPDPHVQLMHNRGKAAPGSFENVTERAGVVLGDPTSVKVHPAYVPYLDQAVKDQYHTGSFSSAFSDLDGDGWQDLVVVSDFGTSQLFWNNKDGTFKEGTVEARFGKEGSGMGLAIADIDADGKLDVFVTAIYSRQQNRATSYTGNKLYQNLGGRQFEDATARFALTDGDWGWGAAAVDLDHNGFTDIVMTNGQFTGMYHNILGEQEHVATPKRVWLSRGNGTFDEVADRSGFRTHADGKGLVTFDADGDGDLDVLIANNGQYPTFYRNDMPTTAGWIGVKVKSTSPGANADALGALVTVTDAAGRSQTQQIGVASAFLGQSDLVANFGLGDANGPVQIDVTWPSTGEHVSRHGVATRTVVTVDQRSA